MYILHFCGSIAHAQTVQFATNPSFSNGEITLCQGSSITFTNSSTNIPSGSQYNWNFPGANPASATGQGPHVITYPNLGSFNASLQVNGQEFSIAINVVSGPNPVFVLGVGSSFTQGFFGTIPYFLSCDGSPISLLSISSNSTGTDANTVHTINWGNGEPDFVYTGTNFIFHPTNLNSSTFYGPGEYVMTYTVDNGVCLSSLSQFVFSGTPPGGSIENTLQAQSFCIPGNVNYTINTQANGPGTQYEIAFNDGFNTTYTFMHPPPAIISHDFPSNSCGTTSTFNGVTYVNSFSVVMTTTNACGQSTSGIAPIIVSESPQADFLMSDTVVCVNAPVTFTNSSFNGSNVTGGINAGMAGCDTLADVIWSYSPLANVNLLNGDLGTLFVTPLGSQWFPGSEVIELSFSEPGVYAITMKVRNKPQCGEDSITKTICVIPELIADYSMPDTSVCVPYIYSPTNNSNSVACENSNIFEWIVTRTNPQNCPYGSDPGYTYLNGTDSSFAEPVFHFTSPGIYEIQLINRLEIEVPGNLCQGDTLVRMLHVKDIPFIEILPLALCEGSEYTLAPPFSECYAENGVTYNWNFAPSSASISTSDTINPTISYATMGNFQYSLTAVNECGQISQTAPVVVEEGIAVQASGPISDCINSPVPLNGLITGAVTTGTWSSDLPAGVFLPSPNASNPSYSFPNGFIGVINFTLSSDSSANGCPPASQSFALNINTTIFAEAGTYDPICVNSPLNLQGSFGGVATSASWTSLGGGTFVNPNNPLTTFTPPLDFTGQITLVLTTNTPVGDCEADSDTVVITVVPLPTIIASADETICEGQSVTISASGGVSYSWNQNIGNGSSHLVSPSNTTIYIVTGTDSLGCSNTDEVQISVLPLPDVLPIGDFIYCPNETSLEVVFQSTFPNTTFEWIRTPGNIGLAFTSGQGNIAQFTTSNITNDLISSTFTVTPELNNCTGNSQSFQITVNPTPQITNSNSQSLCPGNTQAVVWTTNLNPALNVDFSWELTSSGSNLSGALQSGTGNLPSMLILNSGNVTQELVYTVTYHHDSCFGQPFLYTISINPGPVMDPIPPQEICNATAFNDVIFTASVVGTTFSWQLTNVNIPNDVSGYPQPNGTGNIIGTTVSNSGLDPYVLIYDVTPNSVGCSGAPVQFELTVNPELTVITDIPDQFICNNSSSQPVVLTANVANSSVSWNILNLPADVSGVDVLTGSNLIPSFDLVNNHPTIIQDVIFSMQPLNADPNLCPGNPVLYTISVFPTPIMDPVSDSIYCHDEFTGDINFSGLVTDFAWSHNGTSIGLVSSGNGSIPSFQIQNTTDSQSNIEFTVIPQVTLNNAVCEGNEQTFILTVNPNGQVNQLQDLAVCDGDFVPTVNFSTDLVGGAVTYSWTNTNTTIGLANSGSGNQIPTFLGLNPSGTANSGLITVTPTYSNGGLSCVGDSEIFNISINPIPAILSLVDTFICNSDVLNIIPVTNIPCSFAWQGFQNLFVNGISTSTQQSGSINDNLVNNSAFAQTVNYAVTPVVSNTGCTGDTNFVAVVVEPFVFMTSPTVYEICSGTSVNSILTSNIPATYSWFATPNVNILGATTFSVSSGVIQDTLINTTNVPQMIVYTVVPVTVSGNCQGAPLIVNVLVNPELEVIAPSQVTLCNNQSLNVELNANANGTFSWYALNNTSVFGETTAIQNTSSITDLLFNNSSSVQTVTYNIVVTSANQGCTSQNFQMNVDLIPTPSVQNPTNITVCQGSQNDLISVNGTYTSFNWTNDNTSTGIAAFANNVQNFAGFNAQNPNNFPITSIITLSPIYTHNNQVCFGANGNFEITVNPSGQVNFIPNIEVCHDTPVPQTNITTSNITGTTTFTWSNDNLNTGLNLTTGQGNVPGFTSANSFSPEPIISTVSVIGNYVHNNVACPSQPTSFQIIVNPIPTLGAIPNLIFCNNDVVPVFNFNGLGSNHYVWSHNNLAIGLPMNGFGNLPQFTAGNSTQNNIESTVQVTPFYNSLISSLSCEGSPQQFVITVQPSPIVAFQTDLDIYCSRNEVYFTNYSGPNVSFNWNFGDGGTSNLTNAFHEYAGPGVYTVVLTGTHNGTGCIATATKELTILETPTVSFSVDSAMQCYPGIFTFYDDIQAPFTYAIWHFGDGLSVLQNDSVNHVYADYGCYDVQLIVGSENGCIDSLTIPQMVCYFPNPVALFSTDHLEYNSTYPVVTFFNESQFSTTYFWDFGDSTTSTAINPIHTYPEEEMGYGIVLTAYNDVGCSDQYGLYITIYEDRLFYVPNAFTPENSDAINDVFLPVISSGYDLSDYHFVIFNRWGEVVFETNEAGVGWSGNYDASKGGKPCQDGTYVWQIKLRGIMEKDAKIHRGHVNLLR